MVRAFIILIICFSLTKCNYGQDSVLHFNTPAKFYLDSIRWQWLGKLEKENQDFQAFRLMDSTWFLNKENLRNPYFQGIIQQVQSTKWIDSIRFEVINDTMYIIPKFHNN